MALAIVRKLAESGFRKITFAGGEPTLRHDLPLLLKTAQDLGMTTMVVTNGSKLLDSAYFEELKENLDWLILSIDSFNEETNLKSGRRIHNGAAIADQQYLDICQQAKNYGLRLKINTVVSKFNHEEDMSSFIRLAGPERWKIFQALPVEGQNSHNNGLFEISHDQFNAFLNRHHGAGLADIIVPEDNDAMTGSYVMVGPNGCFFDNSKGRHSYSSPILDVGVEEALKEVHFDYQKFITRGAIYDWVR
jgi:radical S-adenosyl methionine domain-containing protein 2